MKSRGKAYIIKGTIAGREDGVIGVATTPARAVRYAEKYLSTLLGSGYWGYTWVDATAVDTDNGGVLRADRATALVLLRAGNPLRLDASQHASAPDFTEIWPTTLL
jgi:hypothetical protein